MASTNTPELKVILCGEYGVGKTSLLRRFTNDTFVDNTNKSSWENRKSTLGLDFYSKKFDIEGLRPIKLVLWDTGGLERIASVSSTYYRHSEAALLVFSLNSIDSFHCLSTHLLEILSLAENARIYLVGNKCDILPHEVTDEDIDLFLEQFPRFSGVFKVSCKSNIGVEEMFDAIAEGLASTSYRIKQFDTFKLHKINKLNQSETNIDSNEDEQQSSCCKSCKEKYNVFSQNSSQIVKLKPEIVNCTRFFLNDNQYLQCIARAEFRTRRERWWFLVVANCESKIGLDLKYNLTLLNTKTEWLKHYSADEYAVFPINIITLILYCLLLIIIIIESVKLIERKYFHLTFKIFIASIIFEFLSLIFVFQFNYNYSYNGYANKIFKTLGSGFNVISNLLFLLLLILIAKGYSVTRARLKTKTSVKISIFMTVYTLCFFFLYFYEQCCFEKAEVLYVYESWIGYCLIVLRFIGLIWFTHSLFKTLKLYPHKKSFFYFIYIMYLIWFIDTPGIILLATFVIPKYQREQIVYGFENIFVFRAHLFFLILTWPAKFNKYFPFHVRTSQIDAMEKLYLNKTNKLSDKTINTIENSGEKLDKFSGYNYAPTNDDVDLLFKINNNNVLFNKYNYNNSSNSKNGLNSAIGLDHNSSNNNGINLGDSNYKNMDDRKKSLPDIS